MTDAKAWRIKAHSRTHHCAVHAPEQKRFIPSVIGPVRNLWKGVNFFSITCTKKMLANYQTDATVVW